MRLTLLVCVVVLLAAWGSALAEQARPAAAAAMVTYEVGASWEREDTARQTDPWDVSAPGYGAGLSAGRVLPSEGIDRSLYADANLTTDTASIAGDRIELSSMIKPPLPNAGALIRAIDEQLCAGNDWCGNAPELSSTLLLALGLAFLKAFNDRSRRR